MPTVPTPSVVYVETEGFTARMRERLTKLPQLVQGLYSNDRQVIHQSTVGIRKLLSIERRPLIEDVIATGIIPRLVEFIRQEESIELQFESAWALTNIVSGTTHHTRVVVDAGAVPIFTKLLGSPNADVREQAIWALGNIAGDNISYRDVVLETGAMPLLLNLLSNVKDNKIFNGPWTLSNFCRGKPSPPLHAVESALQVICNLIRMTDEEVIVDACRALSYISDGTVEEIQAIISSGVCPSLIELLMFRNDKVHPRALRVIGNIVRRGTHVQTQILIDLGVLQCLNQLLGSRKQTIVEETCYILSNITAGLPEQIQCVIQAGIFTNLIPLLGSSNLEVKTEASRAIFNATSGGTPEQVQYLVSIGIIPPFCELLDAQDHNLVIVALDCLENVLNSGRNNAPPGQDNLYGVMVEEAGGIDKLEELTVHNESSLSEKAVALLDPFFAAADIVPIWNDQAASEIPGGVCNSSIFN